MRWYISVRLPTGVQFFRWRKNSETLTRLTFCCRYCSSPAMSCRTAIGIFCFKTSAFTTFSHCGISPRPDCTHFSRMSSSALTPCWPDSVYIFVPVVGQMGCQQTE